MKYKTLFRLVLKLIGVYFCLHACISIASQILSMALAEAMRGIPVQWTYAIAIAPLAGSCIWAAVGLYLFFGGKWIADHAIPGNRPYCQECGYDLSGSVGNRCAECGTPYKREDVRPPGGNVESADKP